MATEDKKILPPPPLVAPALDNTGRFVLPWADWFTKNYDILTMNSLNLSNMRAVGLSFIGQTTNGSVNLITDYNVSTFDRLSVGVYKVVIKQQKFFNKHIFTDFYPIITFSIQPSASTSIFSIDITYPTLDNFTINIYENISTVGGAINKVLYDPINISDIINIAIITNAGTNTLPP